VVAIEDGKTVFMDPDDLRATQSVVTTDHETTAVAAVGDGRRFFAADLSARTCTTLLVSHEEDPGKGMTSAVPGGAVRGRVLLMAASRDGRRLAYLVRVLDPNRPRCGTVGQVRVRDLRTGAEKIWSDDRGDSLPEQDPLALRSLDWARDNRHLSLGATMPVIDTDLPGGTIEFAPTGTESVTLAGMDSCSAQDRLYRGTTGRSAAYLKCIPPGEPRVVEAIYEYDPATATAGARLFGPELPSQYDVRTLAFDPSGDHAFLEIVSVMPKPYRLYRWDSDRGLREVDTRGRRFEQIRW
jgi:hypothetical protein